jgi:Zn-dependent protease/predicted transcriptional regulator
MAPTIRLGSLFGIEIGANWSLLFIFALIAWTLATGVLPSDVPHQAASAYWLAGAVGAVAFYGCLLAHELSHALVARRSGVKVAGITLWLFGGVSRLDGEPKSAGAEALIAGVGPLTSFVIAAIALGLSFATSAAPLVADLFGWLAFVNAALGVFNLVPAFPLDGGRLLSSIFWWRQGSRRQGVHSAVRIGRLIAYLMIGLGVLQLFTGDVIQGIWVAFIGWFLLSAGSSEEAGSDVKAALKSVPVSAAMTSPVITIPDWITVEQFLESVAPSHQFTTYPVHDPSGKLTGVVRLADLVRVGGGQRSDHRLSTVARPISDVPTTRPDEDLAALIERVGIGLENRVLVFDKGELVGILSPVDIARVLTVRQTLRRS